MANPEQLERLKQGVEGWNEWRSHHQDEQVDLRNANLGGANLRGARLARADLRGADLRNAKLTGADFAWGAKLTGADLRGAILARADLGGANLRGAKLAGADLRAARLKGADLTKANLTGCNLSRALLVQTHLENADLSGCHVYGISAWDVHLDGAKQTGLVITPDGTAEITVDDLEVAQFIYLLSRSEKLRKVIDTLGSKGVLIIGSFKKERLEVLHAIRDELRQRHDLLPIMFEFDPQPKKTTIDTFLTLANMSRFVIADLTDAKAVVQELTKIVDSLRSLPIQLIIHESGEMPSMSDSFLVAASVLEPYVYRSRAALLKAIGPKIIKPANARAAQLEERLAEVRRKYLPWQNRKKAPSAKAKVKSR